MWVLSEIFLLFVFVYVFCFCILFCFVLVLFCFCIFLFCFLRRSYQKWHISTHTKEKPNQCEFCQKYIFSLQPNLRKHIRTQINPNTIKSYKILQKLSPKHAAHGVAQSTYPIYRHRKACLSKQPPWRAAGDPRLARGRFRVRAPGLADALRALFSPPSLPSSLGR